MKLAQAQSIDAEQALLNAQAVQEILSGRDKSGPYLFRR